MTDQLALDVATATPRAYGCCGLPCAPLSARPTRERPYPHADDCPNPNVGPWIDRATGVMIRRLKCVDGDAPCPYGGKPPKTDLVDPYDGACCKDVGRETAAA